jgi:hypothetical protein
MSSPSWPLFIVGSPRSGTSALVDAGFAAGFRGYREGNLLSLLKPLFDAVDQHFRSFGTENPAVLMAYVKKTAIVDSLLDIFKSTLESHNPGSPWLDKTCNSPMIFALPYLVRVWPDCRIIFAKRRAIENVQSRLQKFPERDFAYHCQDWVRIMAAWRQTRECLEPWRYLEIDQYDLIRRTAEVASAMVKLLQLGEEASRRTQDALRTMRGQQTEPVSAERVVPLAGTSWTSDQTGEFVRVCGAEMEAFGYSTDETYRRGTSIDETAQNSVA